MHGEAVGCWEMEAQRVLGLRNVVNAGVLNYVIVGHWIRSSLGSDATIYSDEYLPEVYLAAHARMADRSNLLTFSPEGDTWRNEPRVLIFGPNHTPAFVGMQQPLVATRHGGQIFDPACPGRTGVLAVYALRGSGAAFRCTRYQLLFGSQR